MDGTFGDVATEYKYSYILFRQLTNSLMFACACQDIGNAFVSDDATQISSRLSELPDDVREL